MMSSATRSARQPIAMLDYLGQHGWKATRDNGGEEVAGLCPFHSESQPSFYVNRRKQVFYCHGCGRGGGLAQLRQWLGEPAEVEQPPRQTRHLLEDAYAFYEQQLGRSAEAKDYLRKRGIFDPGLMEQMRIGYAPGACLRAHLTRLGHRRQVLEECGLIDQRSRDCFFRCLTIPLEQAASLYGRSIDEGMWRHRFLPGAKGGLYGWEQVLAFPGIVVVEGLLDLAALWQAGFANSVAIMGAHLNATQLAQLCSATRHRIYLCLDADSNGSGQRGASRLSVRLRQAGVEALRVALPAGHDPNSLLAGGEPRDFQRLLDEARP